MQITVHRQFDVRWLSAVDDVGTYFKGDVAVTALEYRVFHHGLKASDLAQRDRLPGGVGEGHVVKAAEVFPLHALRPRHHCHVAVAFTYFGDRVAAEQGIEL
ncbi:hypothetical protein D3C75_876960 [compost metagenome]